MKGDKSVLLVFGGSFTLFGVYILVLALWPERAPTPEDEASYSVGYYLGEALIPWFLGVGSLAVLAGLYLLRLVYRRLPSA